MDLVDFVVPVSLGFANSAKSTIFLHEAIVMYFLFFCLRYLFPKFIS